MEEMQEKKVNPEKKIDSLVYKHELLCYAFGHGLFNYMVSFPMNPKATVNIVNIVQKRHSHSCQKIKAHMYIYFNSTWN